ERGRLDSRELGPEDAIPDAERRGPFLPGTPFLEHEVEELARAVGRPVRAHQGPQRRPHLGIAIVLDDDRLDRLGCRHAFFALRCLSPSAPVPLEELAIARGDDGLEAFNAALAAEALRELARLLVGV